MMSTLRKHVITVLAAATVAAAGLTATPPASARPMSCVQRIAIAYHYHATGWAYWSIGDYEQADHWHGMAVSIAAGCPG